MNYETNLFRTNIESIIKFFTIETKNDGEEYIPAIFTHSGMKYTGDDEFLKTFKYSRTADNGYASFCVSQRNSRQEYLLLGNADVRAYYDESKADFSCKRTLSLTKKYLDKMALSKYRSNMPNICLIADDKIYEIDGKAILNRWMSRDIYFDADIVWISYEDAIIREQKNEGKLTKLSSLQIFRKNDIKKAVIANMRVQGTDYINFYADVYDNDGSIKAKDVLFSTIEQLISAMKIDISERTIKRRIVDNKPFYTENSLVILHK